MKKGASTSLKRKVCIQYFLYLVLYLLLVASYEVENYAHSEIFAHSFLLNYLPLNIERYITSLGLLITLCRLMEPFVINQLFLDIKYYIPCLYKRFWSKKDS